MTATKTGRRPAPPLPATLFVPAVAQNRYIKAVFKGREGTGKTRTSAELIIGAMLRTGDTRPAYFFATEQGVDFVLPLFEAAGIPVKALRTYDLPEAVLAEHGEFELFRQACREARNNDAGALIVDSATHVWDDFLDRNGPPPNSDLRDWAGPKKRWAKAVEFLVNSPFHVAFCARAGDKYVQEEDRSGKRRLAKSGERAKLQADTEYEFSLVLEMIHQGERAGEKVQAKVRKERSLSDKLIGEVIDNPRFEDFEPLWQHMAWSGPGPEDGADAIEETSRKLDEAAAEAEARKANLGMFDGVKMLGGWAPPGPESYIYSGPWDGQFGADELAAIAKGIEHGGPALGEAISEAIRAGYSTRDARTRLAKWASLSQSARDEITEFLTDMACCAAAFWKKAITQ